MPTLDENVIAIADAYATALLDLTEQRGVSDATLDELVSLTEGMERDETLREFMTSAAIDDDVRCRTMEKVFRGRLSDLLLNTLQVMNAKGRSSIVSAVRDRFRLALARVRGQVDVQVTSAYPLTSKLRRRLVDILGRLTGKQPILFERLDESVLGGLVVQIGDEKLDASVSRQIELLRGSLKERASREIQAGKKSFEGTGD
jgi:F-type H+-transporting ATPase subunit delta